MRDESCVPSVETRFYSWALFCFAQMAAETGDKSNQGNLGWRGSGILVEPKKYLTVPFCFKEEKT